MRTDIRLLRLDKFGLAGDAPAGVVTPDALLSTRRRRWPASVTAIDSRPHSARAGRELGQAGRVLRQPRRSWSRNMAN